MANNIYSFGSLSWILLLSGCLFLHQQVYSQGPAITLETVSVREADTVRINYSVEGDESLIDSITLRVYSDLNSAPDIYGFSYSGDEYYDFGELQTLENPYFFQLTAYNSQDFIADTDFHSIIFLEQINAEFIDCDITVNLNWMNYSIFSGTSVIQDPLPFDSVRVNVYDVDDSDTCDLTSEPESVFEMEQPIWDSEETIVLDPDFAGGTYCFQIESYTENDNLSATSNLRKVTFEDITVPDKVEIQYVDVIENEEIHIEVLGDDFGEDEFVYELYRSDEAGGTYVFVSEQDNTAETFSFVDASIPDFDTNPWYYRVKAYVEQCPEYLEYSEVVSSIYLHADFNEDFDFEVNSDLQIDLTWEAEPGWPSYELKKRLQGGDWEYVSDFDSGENSHEDIVDFNTHEGSFEYVIEAPKPLFPNETIRSNVVKVTPFTFELEDEDIPNAFRPASIEEENQTFWVDFVGFVPVNPQMTIYDRNGLELFSTNNFANKDEGWDGRADGDMMPDGAYIYHIYYEDNSGESYEEQGVVYLVR